MNKLFAKRFGTLMSALLIVSSVSFSQFDNVDFLKAGAADGIAVIKAYITPWANAFGAGLNSGWYNTAKPHKLGGFDITTSFNIGAVPSSDGTYDVTKIGLKTFSGTGKAPTVSGAKTNGPTLSYTKTIGSYNVTLASFATPPGTNWKMIPVPTAQIGLGLPLGTEIKGRYIPKIKISDNDISLWGVGVMHSIMQYVPGNKLLPFDVSLFGGYTKLEGNIAINLKPGIPTNYTTAYDVNTSFNNQKMTASVEAWNVGLIASFSVPVINFYGGIGYAKTLTDIKLTGNFPTPTINTAISTTQGVYEDAGVVKNFPAINIESYSGLKGNIGFRLKLAVITIHADYTRSLYNVFSAGLGISFR